MPDSTESPWDWAAVHARCLRETRRVLRGPDAEDAAQEAVARAWLKRAECRSAQARGAWVARIARNEALRLLSSSRPAVGQQSDQSERAVAADPAVEAIAHMDLERAMRSLDPQEAEVARLRFVDDLTDRRIAQTMGTPLGTAKVRLHRLRAKLGAALVDYAPDHKRKTGRRPAAGEGDRPSGQDSGARHPQRAGGESE